MLFTCNDIYYIQRANWGRNLSFRKLKVNEDRQMYLLNREIMMPFPGNGQKVALTPQ